MKSIPSKPEGGKWTKTPPAIDWYVSLLFPRLLGRLVDAAWKTMKIDLGLLDKDRSSLSFSEIAGVRLLGARHLSTHEPSHLVASILLLLLTATRHLTAFFLAASKEFQDPRVPPRSLDYVNPEYSPVTIVMQYLGHLASGQADRFRFGDLLGSRFIRISAALVLLFSGGLGPPNRGG